MARPKGSKNKTTQQLRLMIEQALNNLGGVSYLMKCAETQPAAFLALLGKTLPKDVSLNANGSLKLEMYLSTSRPKNSPPSR